MLKQNCKACVYFNDIGQMGQCRRYPTFQNRHHTEWCGEFELVAIVPSEDVLPVQEAGAFSEPPKKRGRPAKDAK
mgnify:CR=1 FL=1|jgi:hypothetical protein